MKKDNERVFPFSAPFGFGAAVKPCLTKLEIASMFAMQGLLASPHDAVSLAAHGPKDELPAEAVARVSCALAKALLAELEKGEM